MTMERKLVTAAPFIEREIGLRVMRPTSFRGVLDSWANLYR